MRKTKTNRKKRFRISAKLSRIWVPIYQLDLPAIRGLFDSALFDLPAWLQTEVSYARYEKKRTTKFCGIIVPGSEVAYALVNVGCHLLM